MINWIGPGASLETRLAMEKYLAFAQERGISEDAAYDVVRKLQEDEDWAHASVQQLLEAAKFRWALPAQSLGFPAPADIILLQIKGWVGKLVWLAQALNGDFSKWTHVAIMLDDGTVFEAQPGGAVVTDWRAYDGRPFAVVSHKVVHDYPVELKLLSHQRMLIVDKAREYVGAGYNWTTYFYLAAYRLGIRPQWLKNRVQNDSRMICSQAADKIYSDCGVHLFDDGRMPYDITPGDVADLL